MLFLRQKLHVILLYDFNHLDHGCQQFGLRYVFKSNVKIVDDFNLNAFVFYFYFEFDIKIS